jgi:hypothetical protein
MDFYGIRWVLWAMFIGGVLAGGLVVGLTLLLVN